MRRALLAMVALALLGVSLAGCLGGAKQDLQPASTLKPKEITKEAEKRFEELTQVVPSNYTFPGQQLLESVVVWLNDTIDTAADTAVENPRDDGGMDFQTVLKTVDISRYLPPRQAAEVHVKLYWYGNAGSSADLDIFTDLPGATGAYDPSTPQDWNWNIPVKRAVFDTVGVEGQPALVGVQAANGKILPGSDIPFFLQVQIDYARDVLTPHNAYAFTVPEGATGIVLRSVKVTGDEHIQARFAIISPQDELVSFTEFDDIAIPTESVFVPLRAPGEYVFYAHTMTGGFLSLKADSPVPQREVRILPLKEERVVDFAGVPAAAGVVAHDFGDVTGTGTNVSTPYTEGSKASFTLDRFPLRVEGFFDSGGAALAGDVEQRILGPKGLVYDAVRSARVDTDAGSLGWSGDHGVFRTSDPSLLGKGGYTVSVVIDGYTGSIGHTILTYERGPAAPGGTPT
jgi:predicted small lipoprotein YifL